MADSCGRVEVIETSIFKKQIASILTDEEYRGFQLRITANPEIGALIKSGGGIRKVRVAVGSRGKRGGARVIYYWAVRKDVLLLLCAYPKNAAADLAAKQVLQLARVVKESSEVKKQMFEELLESVREAGGILRGRQKPSRRTSIRVSGVRVIRERTSLSQSEFAHLIGVSVKTLQNWEQKRRRPTGPAAALLSIIEHDPALAMKAIHRV
jgi:putative transcriptional regulator